MRREDGYANLVTGAGKANRDPMSNWIFGIGELLSDKLLSDLYVGNKLARRIIDLPSDESVKNWIDIEKVEDDIKENMGNILEDIGAESFFADAVRWARLYGGAAILIIVDDGGTLEDPINYNNIQAVEQLRVYDRTEISYTNTMLYDDPSSPTYGKPEFYTISPRNGTSFMVHESRLLLFNGEPTPSRYSTLFQDWGMPVLQGLTDEIRDCKISYSGGALIIQRISQAIHKVPDLSDMLATEDGEELAMKRLQLIDMSRSLLNTILIDAEEEFELKNIPITGVRDLLDQFGILVSALSGIPYTMLFGRSPAGMNSTGQSDLENYYNMVRQIQKRNIKKPLQKLIRLLFLSKKGPTNGAEPKGWKLEFNPLWLPSDKEKAETEKIGADAKKAKAEAANIYAGMGALDSSEVRKTLEEDYPIDNSIDPATEEIPPDEKKVKGNEGNKEV